MFTLYSCAEHVAELLDCSLHHSQSVLHRAHAALHIDGCPATLQVSVQLDADSIPSMVGALECAKSGVTSSLLPSNLKAAALVENAQEAAKLRLWPLLFDPQTSGGLLGG